MHEKENDNISANGGNVTRASDASKLGEVNISIVYIYADEFTGCLYKLSQINLV